MLGAKILHRTWICSCHLHHVHLLNLILSDSFQGIHFESNNIYYSTDSFIVIIVHSFRMPLPSVSMKSRGSTLLQVWSQSQTQSSSLCLSVLVCLRYNYKCNLFILSNSSKLGDFSTDNVILFPHLGNFQININNSVEKKDNECNVRDKNKYLNWWKSNGPK